MSQFFAPYDADKLWSLYSAADTIRSRISGDTRYSMDDLYTMNEVVTVLKALARHEEREELRAA